jgi:hypothetical protein
LAERPPEQEAHVRRLAESLIRATWDGSEEPSGPGIPDSYRLWVGYGKEVARAYLALLAAYEDRSKAFERAAADCVRLEEQASEDARLIGSLTTRGARAEAENARLYKIIEDIYLEELNGVLCTPPYRTTEDRDGLGGHSYPDYDAAVSRMYCASCRSIWRRIAAAVRKKDEAEAEDEQHARAEHLREAREVEQHQEEKHGA